MTTGRKLKPGQPGTKKLMREFGDKLVCVRYRYDAGRQRRLKTVELILEETPWQPDTTKISLNKIMPIRLRYDEAVLRQQVLQAGGKWLSEKRVWTLPYRAIVKLGLTERIVGMINGKIING